MSARPARRKRQLPPLEPLGWSNWRAQLYGYRELGAYEFGCYTDASPIGEVTAELGPLQLLNPVAMSHVPTEARMAIVVRFSIHRRSDPPARARLTTRYDRYVAVDIGEEIASLLSLALGFRCRSGGLVREFRPGADKRGRPVGYNHGPLELPKPPPLHAPILPEVVQTLTGARREIQLPAAVGSLGRYPHASQRKAIALVRAARQYAQAVWVAESDPELAWLFLISACEVAATERYGSVDPKRKGRRRKPKIHGSTERFTRFIEQYAPAPPAARPTYGRLDWRRMRDHADLLYHWRSRALHDGVPIPPPMCEPARSFDETGIPAETPLGLATSTGTATWRVEDTPMLLHTFAFIARGALLRWWQRTPFRRL